MHSHCRLEFIAWLLQWYEWQYITANGMRCDIQMAFPPSTCSHHILYTHFSLKKITTTFTLSDKKFRTICQFVYVQVVFSGVWTVTHFVYTFKRGEWKKNAHKMKMLCCAGPTPIYPNSNLNDELLSIFSGCHFHHRRHHRHATATEYGVCNWGWWLSK